MVIGGVENCWLGSVVDGLAGHPAAFEAWSAASWADDADVVDVVVVGAVVDLLLRPKINQEIPTTTTATTTMERTRRVLRFRLAALSSASRRAERPAF
jgi:hypothetical protein